MKLETPRLILRDFAADDWRAVLAYQSDPRYLRYYEWTGRTEADVQAFVRMFLDQQRQQPRTRFQLAVTLKADGRLIGNCGIRLRHAGSHEAEIGYELAPDVWRQGYASEAAAEIVRFGFEGLGLHRITAEVVADNNGSIRVLERLGLRQEGRLRDKERYKGRWWDVLLYAILEDEWKAAARPSSTDTRRPTADHGRDEPAAVESPGSAKPRCRPITVPTADGLSLAAQEWGNPGGRPIVFLHGFSQCHLSWLRQVTGPLAERYRLITFDARGHGQSDKPVDAAAYRDDRRWADDLEAVLDAAAADRPVVVGWSSGGRAVVDYLAAHGDDRLAGVVFVAAHLSPDPARFGPAMRLIGKMLSDDLEATISATGAFIRAMTARPMAAGDFERTLAYNMLAPVRVRRAVLDRPYAPEPTLRALRVPVWLVHGEQDGVFLPSMSESAAAVIPTARLSIYHEVGHMPFWEDAGRFNHELASFVEACQPV